MSKKPKLRFKEFSGDWESKKAKELFESISDKKHNGDLEVLSATQDRGVIPRSELNIDIKFEQNNLTSYKKVKESDFIISLRSFQGGIEHSYYTGLVSPAYTVFNFKNNIDLNHRFFAEIFKTQNFINRLNTLTYGIRDGKAISFKDFSDVKLTFPTKKEQEKIAFFFSLIDDKISLQGEKVEALKDYKKGMMQKIFSRELRFKDDDGRDYPEWEEKKLYEVLTERKEKNAGNLRVCSVAVKKGVVDQIEHLGRSFAAKDTSNYNLVKYGDVIYTKSPTGDFPYGIIKQSFLNENVVVSPLYGVFKPLNFNLGYILHCYFYYRENTNNYLYSIIQKGAKNTINITNTTFLSKSLILPIDENEQMKMAKLFIELDNKINKEQEKLNYLNEYKKGLLQQMFV